MKGVDMSDLNKGVDLSQVTEKNSGAFRICAKVFSFWQLTDLESSVLLGLSAEEWFMAKCARSLLPITHKRLSHILWIARLITDLYPLDKELSIRWLRRNNFEEPFLGMSPIKYMLLGEKTLESTPRYLDEKFLRWGALRDERNELIYLNDELRMEDEPLETLVCMAFRVIRSWQLSSQEELALIGADISSTWQPKECVVMPADAPKKLRMLVLVDLMLWHLLHDHNRVVAWVRENNTHPLFARNSPLHLLCSGNREVMKVVYAYLCNISP